jgi:hypothetical protein
MSTASITPHSNNSNRIRISVILILAVLPFIFGVLCDEIASRHVLKNRNATVFIAMPMNQPKNSTGRRIADDLQQVPGFDWKVVDAKDTALAFQQPSLLAVVAIPNIDAAASTAQLQNRSISITPAVIEPAAETYAKLVQVVSETASQIGVSDLLLGVSGARIKLNIASITGAGINGALSQASSSLDAAMASFNELILQSEPLIANTGTLLDSFQQSAETMKDIANKLRQIGTEISTLDITLGDVNRDVRFSQNIISELSPLQPQISVVARLVADALSNNENPQLKLLGSEIDHIFALIDTSSRRSPADGLFEDAGLLSMNNLSSLLAVKIDDNTRVADFLLLTAKRLQSVSDSIDGARYAFNRVNSLLDGAKAALPDTKVTLTEKLEEFRRVIQRLIDSINAATRQLPSTSPQISDAVSKPIKFKAAHGIAREDLARASTLVLVEALMVVSLSAALRSKEFTRGWRMRAFIPLTFLSLVALVPLTLGSSSYIGAVMAVAGVSLLALAAIFWLLILMLNGWGFIVAVGLILTSLVFSSVVTNVDEVNPANLVWHLLPSSYITAGLNGAAISGFDAKLFLPMLTLGMSGLIASLVCILRSRILAVAGDDAVGDG